MPGKLKAAAAIASGTLTALAAPAAVAQAAPQQGTPPPRAGAAAPHLKPVPGGQKVTGPPPKVSNGPNASCSGGTITWQDRYDGRYLEVYHSETANGNWIDAYPGNGTCTQRWFAVASGVHSQNGFTMDTYGMVNDNSFLCLAAPTSNVGNAHVVQEACGYNSYNYKWVEFSDHTGWLLIENNAPGYANTGYISSYGIMACEDTANHWIYTSWTYIPNQVDNLGATNCIWH